MVLFEAENLSFTYPKNKYKALNGLNFKINQGDFVLLMGKSGSGKSTLLKMMTPSLSPSGITQGCIINNAKSQGFVVQNLQTAFVSQRVRGELAFSLENLCLCDEEIALKIGETASFFNISDILDHEISTLSGGEKAIVSIAAAMISGAHALILDEPLSQLDKKACFDLIDMLKRINDELGVTIIISSHSSNDLINIANRLLILDNGKIICDSSPREAVKRNDIIHFFPLYTSLYSERPLTIKEAIGCETPFNEKPFSLPEKTECAVSLKNIRFAYSKNTPDILSSLSFKAYKGKINAVIGANGSGKTTLLKIIAGIKKQYSGSVKVKGKIAYMPQEVKYLFTMDRVCDEISFDTAHRLGISDCLECHPFDLSAGQSQRLALGILLEQNPDIFLLDEPSKSLDYFDIENLKNILRTLCSEGKTVIMVSHDLDFTGDISDFVSFLADGCVCISSDRRTVFSSLSYYTTQIRRITANKLSCAVSKDDLA